MARPTPLKPDKALVRMGIYLFDTKALVTRRSALPITSFDFGKDVIPEMIRSHRVSAYKPYNIRKWTWGLLDECLTLLNAQFCKKVPRFPITPASVSAQKMIAGNILLARKASQMSIPNGVATLPIGDRLIADPRIISVGKR